MTNFGPGLEVPAEMREMLEKGVSQARAGFGKVMAAADEAAATLDKKTGSAQSQAMDFHRKTMTFTEQNVSAAFDLAANLVKAKSLDEVMKLQTEYMTKQFAALRGQIQDAGQAIQSQAQAATAEMAQEAKAMQSKAKAAVDESVAMAKDAAATAQAAATKAAKKK